MDEPIQPRPVYTKLDRYQILRGAVHTHKHRRPLRLVHMFGSVNHAVLHQSGCPVAIVPGRHRDGHR